MELGSGFSSAGQNLPGQTRRRPDHPRGESRAADNLGGESGWAKGQIQAARQPTVRRRPRLALRRLRVSKADNQARVSFLFFRTC